MDVHVVSTATHLSMGLSHAHSNPLPPNYGALPVLKLGRGLFHYYKVGQLRYEVHQLRYAVGLLCYEADLFMDP